MAQEGRDEKGNVSDRWKAFTWLSDEGYRLGNKYNTAKELFDRVADFCKLTEKGKAIDGFIPLKLYCGFYSSKDFIELELINDEFKDVIDSVKQAYPYWQISYLKDKHKKDKRKPKSKEQTKLRTMVSGQIVSRLKKRKGSKKGMQTEFILQTVLGYTIEDLKKSIESKFLHDMSWDNHGEVWHLDHKKPDSWFEYTSIHDEGFKQSWSIDNLQPLYKEINIFKGNKFEL